MELSSIQHVDPSQLSDFKTDIFITALGHETRSTSISRLIENISCRKVALVSSRCPKTFSYEENREYYVSKKYELVSVDSDVPDLKTILGSIIGNEMGLMFDCTNMPPSWYYEFFRWFDSKQVFQGLVRMRVVYTMANFVGMTGTPKVKELTQFLQPEIKSSAKKKRALVLGIGHEKDIAASIYKMVDPDLLYLYYADPPVEKSFVEQCFINNHALISATPIKNLVSYPIRNGQAIYQSLINTILPLRHDHSIIVVPHGPKIFSVVAMLVHLGYPDIRISYPSFNKPAASDRSPGGESVILDILFEGEE